MTEGLKIYGLARKCRLQLIGRIQTGAAKCSVFLRFEIATKKMLLFPGKS